MTAVDRLQGLIGGGGIKQPCRAGTTAAITLEGLQTVDGVSLASADRVLVMNQGDTTTNGIYRADTGTWTRDVDFDGAGDAVKGTAVLVTDGTVNGGTYFYLTTDNPVQFGTSAITFTQAGAAALTLATAYVRSNLLSQTSAAGVAGAIGVPTLSGANIFTGSSSDFTSGRIKVPTRVSGDNGTDAANTSFTQAAISGAVHSAVGGTVLRGYLDGCVMSNNSSTPNSKLDVTAGIRADDTNAAMLVLTAGSIDFTTAGVVNGLDTGSVTSLTTYHAFGIGKADGTVGYLAGATLSPTLPSGYTYKRRIGSWKTDSSAHLRPMFQDGDYFQYVTPVSGDISVISPGTAATTNTLAGIPSGVNVIASVRAGLFQGDANANYAVLSDPATSDVAPSATQADIGLVEDASGANQTVWGRFAIRTNSSSQIRARVSFSNANTSMTVDTLGWWDRRGRDS